MISRVLKVPRPPEATLEPAWPLVLPRNGPAVEVCALELRISRDLWRGFWSHPSFCTELGWAPWGHAGRSKSTLYLDARGRETDRQTLERQADRHTVGSDAWSRDRTGGGARGGVLKESSPRGGVCLRPSRTCARTLREEAPLSPASRVRSARLQKPSCKGGRVWKRLRGLIRSDQCPYPSQPHVAVAVSWQVYRESRWEGGGAGGGASRSEAGARKADCSGPVPPPPAEV